MESWILIIILLRDNGGTTSIKFPSQRECIDAMKNIDNQNIYWPKPYNISCSEQG